MNSQTSTAVWVAAGIYLGLLLLIGAWAARRTRNESDFFVAGRRAGLWATGLATMAASFSGFVFLGGPGLTYRVGLGALFIVLPVGFTAAMLSRVIGEKLHRLASQGVLTIPDALARRYPRYGVGGLAAVAVLLGTIAYLGLQLQGVSILLRNVLGVAHPDHALWIGGFVILAYSIGGGMVAGLYTDVLQGALMLVAAVVVFFFALRSSGGWSVMLAAVAQSDPRFLEPTGRLPLITLLGFFFVFGIGVLGQPHLLHKFYMLRDARHVRMLPLIFGGSQMLCLLIWLGVGLAVPALVAQGQIAAPASPDDVTPRFMLEFLPNVLSGVLVAAILAAVMSTADSFLNIGAGALVRDLPRALGRPLRNELACARGAVILIAIAAAAFSRLYFDLIALVGTFAFGAFAAALAPALAVGLWWKRATSLAAASSIVVGLGSAVGLEFLARQTWFTGLPRGGLTAGALPAAAALAASFLVFFVVSWLRPEVA